MKKLVMLSLVLGLIFTVTTAHATPTFQVYIDGGTAGSLGGDEDSWFTSASSFNLIVVGAYGPNTQSLSQVTLVASSPQGQTGTLTVNGATLLTSRTSVPGGYNPNDNANTDILTNVAGIDGYSTKSFLPASQDDHYPFKNEVSDFTIFAVGDFSKLGAIHDYNADNGSIALAGFGQEKVFHVEAGGFEWLHFDVYGYDVEKTGKRSLKSTWDDNPNSHDSTYTAAPVVPVPGAISLGCIGTCLVGWLRNRRAI